MTLLIACAVLLGTAFLFGVLVGGDVQRHLLRGHEGTRAETLREMRRQRQAHIDRRREELYGPPPSHLRHRSRARQDDHDRWWRRHPGPARPTLSLPDDPVQDDTTAGSP